MKTPYHTCEFVTRHTWRSHVVHHVCMHTSFQEDYAHVFSRKLCTRLFNTIMYTSFQEDYVRRDMWFEACDFKSLEKRCACGLAKTGFSHQLKPHINIHTKHHATHMEKSRHTYEKVTPHISKSHSPGCIFSYLLSLLSLLYKLTVELTFETCRPLRMRETSVRGHATTGTSCSSQTKIASRSPWPLPWVLLAACCWDSYVSTAVR